MSCSVKGCLNYKRFKPDGVTFHLFPRDHRLEEWLVALGKDQTCWQWTKCKFVCSKHFKDSDFLECSNRRMLKADAVPSLHLRYEASASFMPPASLTVQREETGKNLQLTSLHSDTSLSEEEHESSQNENYSDHSDSSESELDDLTREDGGGGFSCQENKTLTPESNSKLNNLSQQRNKEKLRLRYFGDVKESDMMHASEPVKRNWEIAKRRISQQRRQIRCLQQTVRRLKTRATTLNMLFKYLKNNGLVTEAGNSVIKALLKRD